MNALETLIDQLRAGPAHDVEETHRMMLVAADVLEIRFEPMRDIEEFHEKFGLRYRDKPRALSDELSRFRREFMDEELKEYKDAAIELEQCMSLRKTECVAMHLEDMLDALVDLTYVVLGTAQLHGFDFREAWRRVHAANMKKVRAIYAEQSARGSTFDVVKPPGWTAPSHADLVMHHAHEEP